MIIAIPNHDGNVNQHFGQSRSFAIIEIDDNSQIVSINEVSSSTLEHQHEGLAGLLKSNNVEVAIVGGIGQGALDALESQSLKVLFGAAGNIKEVAESFAKGQFTSKRSVCSHHGKHH